MYILIPDITGDYMKVQRTILVCLVSVLGLFPERFQFGRGLR